MQLDTSLKAFNQLPPQQAKSALLQCCGSQRWARCMVAARPFATGQRLLSQADSCWQNLREFDYLDAFAGHPKIGDINSLCEQYATTKALASGEQAGVGDAGEAVITALSRANSDYEKKFGFIFIVCASGKSGAEMLALLRLRLSNSRQCELAHARAEQAKITAIRLQKMFLEAR